MAKPRPRLKRDELDKVRDYPLRMYSAREIASIFRLTPIAFKALYAQKVPPIKAGTKKGSKAYWLDSDVIKIIDIRFPGLDRDKRKFMHDQLLKGNQWKE